MQRPRQCKYNHGHINTHKIIKVRDVRQILEMRDINQTIDKKNNWTFTFIKVVFLILVFLDSVILLT